MPYVHLLENPNGPASMFLSTSTGKRICTGLCCLAGAQARNTSMCIILNIRHWCAAIRLSVPSTNESRCTSIACSRSSINVQQFATRLALTPLENCLCAKTTVRYWHKLHTSQWKSVHQLFVHTEVPNTSLARRTASHGKSLPVTSSVLRPFSSCSSTTSSVTHARLLCFVNASKPVLPILSFATLVNPSRCVGIPTSFCTMLCGFSTFTPSVTKLLNFGSLMSRDFQVQRSCFFLCKKKSPPCY